MRADAPVQDTGALVGRKDRHRNISARVLYSIPFISLAGPGALLFFHRVWIDRRFGHAYALKILSIGIKYGPGGTRCAQQKLVLAVANVGRPKGGTGNLLRGTRKPTVI